MTRAWDKEISESPDRNRTHDLPNTWQALRAQHSPSSLNYTTHDKFDSADPSSMQDACHIWTQINGLACSPWVLVAQWIERPPCVWEVMGLIPVRDSDISFSHARVMLNNSSFYANIYKGKICGKIHLGTWQWLKLMKKINGTLIIFY